MEEDIYMRERGERGGKLIKIGGRILKFKDMSEKQRDGGLI